MVATLDYTGDSGTAPNDPHSAMSKDVVLHKRLKATTIWASDTTMAALEHIPQNDILQVFHIPAGFVIEFCVCRIITASTDAADIEVGLAGTAVGIAAMGLDGTAGDATCTIDSDDWFDPIYVSAADTIDVQYIDADVHDGEVELWVFGKQLNIGS